MLPFLERIWWHCFTPLVSPVRVKVVVVAPLLAIFDQPSQLLVPLFRHWYPVMVLSPGSSQVSVMRPLSTVALRLYGWDGAPAARTTKTGERA